MSRSSTYLLRIDATMNPERYPAGHALHDATHPFWTGREEDEITGAYQWDADTLDAIADVLKAALADPDVTADAA